MSLKVKIDAWARANLRQFVTGNATKYTWRHCVMELGANMLGMACYSREVLGNVIHLEDDFVVIKEAMSKFAIVQLDLLREDIQVGDRVQISFYQPRRLNGTLADGSEDPAVNGCKTRMIGHFGVHLPAEWEKSEFRYQRHFALAADRPENTVMIQNPYLIDLVGQIESSSSDFKLDNGMRTVAGLIIDSKARSFKFVDPPEDESATTPPEVSFSVVNGKFCGKVQIQYDRAMDYYRLIFTETGDPEVIDDVDAFSLGGILHERICDGQWKFAKTTVLKRAPKKKAVAGTSAA